MTAIAGLAMSESVVALPRFQTKMGERMIDPRRIIYLSAQLNYTLFHLENSELVLTSLPLSFYASFLEAYGFIRVHKSHLLNGYYLNKCFLKSNRQLRLPNGTVIEVARRRQTAFKRLVKGQGWVT